MDDDAHSQHLSRSAYVLLHHYMGSIDGAVGAWGFARGGMGAITQALAASLKASGGDPVEAVASRDSLLDPTALDQFAAIAAGEPTHG